MTPSHMKAIARIAQALRQYDDADHATRNPPEGVEYGRLLDLLDAAIAELRTAGRQVVDTSNLDGEFTSPLTAESGNAQR